MVGWWIVDYGVDDEWMAVRQASRQAAPVGESVNRLGAKKFGPGNGGSGYDGPWSASLGFWERAVPLTCWTMCMHVCRHVWLSCLSEASCSKRLAYEVGRCWFEKYSGSGDLSCLDKGDSIKGKHHKYEATRSATAETNSLHGRPRQTRSIAHWP